jgi:hypothetical protein
MNTQAITQFPPENANQFLEVIAWVVVALGIVWLMTSVIGALQRRTYNLTHAESGRSKKVLPDFLSVDRKKREAAIARGELYHDALRREAQRDPVGSVSRWSGVGATLAALVGLFFMAVTTLSGVVRVDQGLRELGNWEKLKILVAENQLGAIVCVAVIVSNAYMVFQRLNKSGQ